MNALKSLAGERVRHVRPGLAPRRLSAASAPLFSLSPAPGPAPAPSDDRHCRLLNVTVAILGLILALPSLLVIALAVKWTSPGSVLYSQRRVGLDRRGRSAPFSARCRRREDRGGRLFTIYKFRTMLVHDAVGEQWARAGDPRITAVGAILRRYRLDELPQLCNVLLGDMNIVGPRPEQPAIFQRLKGQIVDYGARQRVLPGITGWAQINQRYDQTVEDVKSKVALDLEYLRCRSAARDLRIMMRTVPVMIGARGAV